MAELYLARLGGAGGFEKLVAIKRMLPHLSENPQFVAMFENEGRIAARLTHPNVCEVYELGEADGQLFLAMEYLRGLSWAEVVDTLPREDQVVTARIITGVLVQACEGLAYAHELVDVDGSPLPVVHRDVSPNNLFLTVGGIVKLLDFGVSKILTEGTVTRTGMIKGKLPYMAPEQIRGEAIDRRADVFSLGVVTWEAATGRRLFDRSSDFQIWKAVTEEAIPPIPSGPLQVIGPAIDRALAREPGERCASAREFAELLRAAVAPLGGPLSPAELAALVSTRYRGEIDDHNKRLASAVHRVRGTDEDLTTQLVVPPNRDVTTTRQTPVDDPGASATAVDVPTGDEAATDRHAPAPAPDARRDRPTSELDAVEVHIAPRAATGVAALIESARGPLAIATPGADEATTGRRVFDAGTSDSSAVSTIPRLGAATGPRRTTPRWRVFIPVFGLLAIGTSIAVVIALSSEHDPARSETASGGAISNDASVDLAVAPADPPPATPSTTVAPAPIDALVVADEVPDATASIVPSATPSSRPSKTRAPGFYTVNSKPYAAIFIDGRSYGDTPLYHVVLRAGTHVVRAQRPDGPARSFSIRIEPNTELNSGTLSW